MSLEPDHDHSTPIPEELRNQLAQFQKHLWRIKVMEAILAGLAGLIVSFLIVFILDRLLPTPPLVRLAILVAGTSLFAIFAPLWIRRWVFGHKREEQLARLISKKFPKLGDRLLGVVELQDQTEQKASLSPELRAAAMAHVSHQASQRDMTEALPSSRHQKLALGVIGGVALMVAGFALAPKAGINSLKRWLMPFSETERYTFTQLDFSEIPNPYTVPYGEPFSLAVPVSEKSDKIPLNAEARYGSQDWQTSSLEENRYQFEFPGQQVPQILTVKAGDAIHRIKVEPQVRPELADLKAKIKLPDYLQQDDRLLDIRTGVLTVLEGSQVSLIGNFTRALAEAQGTLSYLNNEEIPDAPAAPSPRQLGFAFQGETLTSDSFPVNSHRAEMPLFWTDVKGLSGASRFLLRVEPTADQPPNAYIQGIERQVVILEEETLEFEVFGEDDFGLREMGLTWEGEFTKPTDDTPAKGELILQKGSPTTARLTDLAIFSPKTHNISPQKLILRAYTQDYKKDRERQFSQPLTVYILTRDEHAQMLKNKFDRILGELEDAARQEQNNLDANERLSQKDENELQKDENQQKLAENTEKERENTEKMKELSKKMEELFKDAVRNKTLDPKAMKKLSDAMNNLEQLAEEDLPEISEKLAEAQDKKNAAQKTKSDLQEAIEKQKNALKKMQETIQQANEANQNFEASTFVNRLKRAASEEEGIASSFIAAMNSEGNTEIDSILGSSADERFMDPVHFRLLKSLVSQQKRTNSDIRWIQEDLGHFHARTQKPEHKKLIDEMTQSQINLRLEALRRKIETNQTFHAIRKAKLQAEQLRKWAKDLGGDDSSESGGGGGDGGGGDQAQEDFEFMLKVMRMVQSEQDIRARTRSLEQLRRSLKSQNP